jgi:hypothetical protein
MASTTVITTPATSSNAVANLSGASVSTTLTPAGSGPLALSSSLEPGNKGFHSSMQPPQMQSQPSSQQSFTMSQPSSQQNAGNTSIYRQYNEPARHANENVQVMPIYSVRPLSQTPHLLYFQAISIDRCCRPLIQASMSTRWK